MSPMKKDQNLLLSLEAKAARARALADLRFRAEVKGCSITKIKPRNVIEATVQGQMRNHGERTAENYEPSPVIRPSSLRPGVAARIEVYAKRVTAGEEMFHEDDISLDDCDRLGLG